MMTAATTYVVVSFDTLSSYIQKGDEPDYFKDFFANMPTLQNNPFAQFQPPSTSANPFQPTASPQQQHQQQLYGSVGTGSGFFGADVCLTHYH